MAREINLVPDVKGEMIKALKLRNLIFFLSAVVAAASVGVTVVVGLIMGGQQLALTSKQDTIKNLSDKLNSYADLNDFLTIKDQLGSINTLTNNKKVLSRTFNILSALIPRGADTITISELNVNLAGDAPVFSFDAQANSGKEPFIDYAVLESFKKSMDLMRYDYGNYVDAKGNTIPAYCIIETNDEGSFFNESNQGIYAYWTINAEGCNPSKASSQSDTDSASSDNNTEANQDTANTTNQGYETETYKDQTVVRIWRTPQFSKWYKSGGEKEGSNISLDGTISNIPHFASSCISYTGDNSKDTNNPKWTETISDSCMLIPGGQETGIKISDSSNGRGQDDELVLRFSAQITISPEVYKFSNHHVMAIAPTGRHNVTDSYVQIQAMFGKRADDCANDDDACSAAPTQGEDTNSTNSDNKNSDNTNSDNANSNGGTQNG